MDGLIFGLMDNGVLLIFAYIGLDIEKKISDFLVQVGVLKNDMRVGLGAILGGTIGNTFSDFLGAVADPTMHAKILGIFIGCIIPVLLIPVFEKLYLRWSA